jgi:hypothetical protein
VSELTARLAIYGAIDHAVLDDRIPAELVGTYLTPYQPDFADPSVPPAAGWYDALARMLAEGTEAQADGAPVLPPVSTDPSDALTELARLPLRDEIDAEHRLRALYLARRLLSVPNASADDPFVGALQRVVEFDVGSGSAEDPVASAMALSELIDGSGAEGEAADGDQPLVDGDSGDDYVDVIATGADRGLLSETTARLASATCEESTTWFQVPGSGDVDVAAVVASSVVEPDVPIRTLTQLRSDFHPGHWPVCMPTFWISMTALWPTNPLPSPLVNPGTSKFVYRERVGDVANNSVWFEPVLDLWYDDIVGGPATARDVVGFAIQYGLASPVPPGATQDQRILIDDGELTVRRTDTGNGLMTLTASTHKVLAMKPPISGPGVAVFACASGWADQAKALITGCLLHHASGGAPVPVDDDT